MGVWHVAKDRVRHAVQGHTQDPGELTASRRLLVRGGPSDSRHEEDFLSRWRGVSHSPTSLPPYWRLFLGPFPRKGIQFGQSVFVHPSLPKWFPLPQGFGGQLHAAEP